jgi:hypothetical protein
LAEEYLAKTQITQGLFLILVGGAQAPVWEITGNHHIEPKRPMPYVNHYSFHILDPEWGHITIKISGHPPFPRRSFAAWKTVCAALVGPRPKFYEVGPQIRAETQPPMKPFALPFRKCDLGAMLLPSCYPGSA